MKLNFFPFLCILAVYLCVVIRSKRYYLSLKQKKMILLDQKLNVDDDDVDDDLIIINKYCRKGTTC